MRITILWGDSDEDVALMIGTIMCGIPHKGEMPISVEIKEIEPGKMVTTITNEDSHAD